MRVVNVRGKTMIGCGAFGSVYKISPKRVVKVYDRDEGSKHEMEYISKEIELSFRHKNVLPVLDLVLVKHRGKFHYGLIKKYLPRRPKYKHIKELSKILPKELKWDLKEENVRLDRDGTAYLIDTNGKTGNWEEEKEKKRIILKYPTCY